MNSIDQIEAAKMMTKELQQLGKRIDSRKMKMQKLEIQQTADIARIKSVGEMSLAEYMADYDRNRG